MFAGITSSSSTSAASSSSSSSSSTRRAFLLETAAVIACGGAGTASLPHPAAAAAASPAKRCTDIESCREIGERRDAENLARNPIVRLGDGLQYKVLSPGVGGSGGDAAAVVVKPDSNVRIIYSVSQANGSYMYSRGMGYNKIDAGGGRMVKDEYLDSLAVTMGSNNQIPLGIQKALVGAKRGERRRIQCPPQLGFETSNWEPKPTTFRGERQMIDYRSTLTGSSGGVAFPAPTIWDVEVVSIR